MKKLFYNGEVVTADKTNSVHQAVVVENDKIAYVGSTQKALKHIDEETETIDLCGCAMLPGFIDCHIHMAVAETKSGDEINLSSRVNQVKDVLEKIEKAAISHPKGEWIVGSAYNHEELQEKRHITLEELDKAAPENPVILVHKSGHLSVCNSKAFEIAKKSGLQFPTEHTVLTQDGKLSGVIKETAHFMMLQKSPLLPKDDVIVKGIEKFTKKMLRAGITSSHDAGGFGTDTYRTLQRARDEGKLNNRVYTMLWSLFGKDAQIKNANTIINAGFYTGLGDQNLKIGPLKLMVDGSAVGGTCATNKPILPGLDIYPASFTQDELDEIFIQAHKAGFQLTAHAAGDKAVEMTINAIEKAMLNYPRRDPRHRIEHCFMCPKQFMTKIKQLGILPIPNPGFLSVWGDVFEKYYGDRIDEIIPLKSFEDHGIMTPFGSDAMVIDEFEPLFGIAAAMERKSLKEQRVIGDSQKIDFMRALKCNTYFGAYASFEEDIKGSIEVGKLADLVVLSGSVIGKSPEKIRKLKVMKTYMGGRSH
jgi:predicted amidohydrolase YtcJ